MEPHRWAPAPPSSVGNKNSSCLASHEEGAAPKPACETLASSQRNLGGGRVQEGGGGVPKSSHQTSSPAWPRASLGSRGSGSLPHWALCLAWLLRPHFKQPEERDSHGIEQRPTRLLFHPCELWISFASVPLIPKLALLMP